MAAHYTWRLSIEKLYPARLPNQLHLLYLAAFLMDFAVSGVMFGLTRRAAELGASAFIVGLLGALMFGVYVVSALVVGPLSDRWGRRPVAVISALLAALTATACGWTTDVATLLGLSAVFGVGLGGFWPTVIAWLGSGAQGGALNRRLARFSMAWNIGLLLGFALTGKLFTLGPSLPFYVAGAVVTILAGLLLVPVAPPPTEVLPANHVAIPPGLGFRKTGWLANFALTLAMSGAIALFPKLATALEITADRHGLLLAISRGSALIAFWTLQHVEFWRTRLWPLWVAQAVVVVALASIGVAGEFWQFALALGITGAVSGYTYQASIYFTLEESAAKGKGSAFHEAILASGMFLGPVLAGLVGERFSLRSPFYFCAGTLAALVIAQITVVAWRRHAAGRLRHA
jgi:MFS family permease